MLMTLNVNSLQLIVFIFVFLSPNTRETMENKFINEAKLFDISLLNQTDSNILQFVL